jgi:hypothetical protein
MTLVARGLDEAIEDRSAADQTLESSQSVMGFEGLSRETGRLDEDTSPPACCLSMGSRCIDADA